MDEFERNQKIVNERKKANELRKKMYAKNRLEFNITKKIRTTMIGAIATFEDIFGGLWGIDLEDQELTPKQAKYRDMWEEARREILNKGNMQIRAAHDEISEYDTEWNRYKIDFIKKDKENEK
jgi:hypothetical protein